MITAVTRRVALLGASSFSIFTSRGSKAIAQTTRPASRDRLAAIEARHGGRLGVVIANTATSEAIEHRADERFPLTSTFKFLAAAAVLKLIDVGDQKIDTIVPYMAADVEPGYSPVTRNHAGTGMSIADLCAAAVVLSDNTAGNLLLRLLGGPDGLTRFCRSLGDQVTRLDRTEPALNSAIPAMNVIRPVRKSWSRICGTFFSEIRCPWHRGDASRTGSSMISSRAAVAAGLPANWSIGDKTAAGEWHRQHNRYRLAAGGAVPILVACTIRARRKRASRSTRRMPKLEVCWQIRSARDARLCRTPRWVSSSCVSF